MRLSERLSGYLPYLPSAVAVVLALPVLGFTYLWDDYNFLTNAMFYQLHDWLPDPTDPFYRPISRGVYFTLLDIAGKGGPALGHLLNLLFHVGIVYLLTEYLTRTVGKRAGLTAGLLYAGLGVVPLLVGWISCDQDLLAMLFVMIALHLRYQRRDGVALAAVAGALLSKETTLGVVPAFILFDWILDRRPYRIGRSAGLYGALVVVWGAIHPAVRILASRGLRPGATGYVGMTDPQTWVVHAGRYVLALFNFPNILPLPRWPDFGLPLVLVAFLIAQLGLRLDADKPISLGTAVVRKNRQLLLAGMLAFFPLLLTSSMIEGLSPYYAAFPAVGFSMAAGTILADRTIRFRTVMIGAYLVLGMWARGPVTKATEVTEPNFRAVSGALRTVESGFRRLYPRFPEGARIYLSVQARGAGGVYTHMYSFQVLRIWYRDRSLRAVRPEARTPFVGPEFLAVVGPDRDVIDINTRTLFARSASGREPDYEVCERAIRAYAAGLAASGET